ncbi:phosphoribosylanthranilate isomerase [Aminipila sp.]|uniref:phosphoribosylanthranilate isomerase n=1 Tax=Aminipila sp. TaxID=2060095 RepID=UPI001DBEF6E7|nr:phosphoribosylanthranilate isomerase [Aminipila sp.]MBE6034214.1 phosphoribosylanthranilate isomerase [Clostridiales bacterium]
MTKIKICGICSRCDIDYVNEAKPDYIGFVFAKSQRQIDFETAEAFHKALDKEIKAVGVFVDEPLERIITAVKRGIIDMVQLHGAEEEAYIRKLKEEIEVPVIKAVRAEKKEDVLKYQNSHAEYLLFDHGGGGTGKCFNWSLIENVKKPFILAGGLHAANVQEGIQLLKPFAVDISSGAEEDGKKNKEKIKEIVRRVRNE